MKIDYKSELEEAKKEIIELKKQLKMAEYLLSQLMKDKDEGEEL